MGWGCERRGWKVPKVYDGRHAKTFFYLSALPPVLYRGISIRAYERPRTGGNGSGPSLVPVEHAGVDGDDGKDAVISFFFFFFF